MARMTAAQFIADTFASYGVTNLFFVPVMLSQTLAEIERRTSIQRIMTHGEKSAVYMADGYARASGRPGVCMSQCIGTANLAAGLRDAHLSCTPMIAITGGAFSHTRDRHTYQQVEDMPLFKPVTKYSAHVDDIARLPDVLRQAFRAATTGTPGPAHIQMIGHMGEIDMEEGDFELVPEERFGQTPPFRPEPDGQSVADVARRIGLVPLRRGSRGDDVKVVQNRLNALDFNCGTADGVFGRKTRRAVKGLQRACLLVVDGVVGAKSWSAMWKPEVPNGL